MKMSPAFTRRDLASRVVIFLLALSSVIASLNAHWGLWGIDSSRAFPPWVRISVLLILSVGLFPPISFSISESLHRIFGSVPKRNYTAIYLAITGLALALFIGLSSRNSLLGDGFNILGNVAGGMTFSPTEPMEYAFHRLAYLSIGGKDPRLAFRISSYLAGVLFLWTLYYFIEDKRRIFPALALAANFAAMQFFFGYVENYTFSFVFIFVYAMFAYEDFQTKNVRIRTVAALALAISFHLISLVMLPSLLYLAWLKYRPRRGFFWGCMLLSSLALAAAAVAVKGKVDLREIFVPPWPTSENPYFLFSGAHLKDMLNILFLNYPMLFLVVAAGKMGKASAFWLFCLLPSLGAVLALDPKISAYRDWDLLSVASAPLLAWATCLLINRDPAKPGRQHSYIYFVPLTCLAVLHIGGWIYGNTKRDYSYAIIKEFVKNDIHYSSSYYGGYRNKSWARLAYAEHGDIDEVIRADEIRYKGDPTDSLNNCNLARNYLDRGDTSLAVQFVRDNWRRSVSDDDAVTLFGSIMVVTRNYKDAEEIYQAYLATGGKEYSAVYNLGFVLDKLGQVDSALMCFDKAFALWDDAPIANEMGFYIRAMSLKKYDMAESGFKRIYARIPAGYKPSINVLLNDLASRNYGAADSLTSAILNAAKSKDTENTR